MIKKISIVLLSVVLLAGQADARYCNSPYCSMCNRLFGPIGSIQAPVTASLRSAIEDVQRLAPSIDIDSTPMDAVDAALAALDLKPSDILYDLGCGDGRVLIRAVQKYGCQGVGIEIDPKVAEYARQKVREADCGSIRIVTGDARKFKLDAADAVFLYQHPPLMQVILPKLRTSRIVSYLHPLPNRVNRKLLTATDKPIYVAEPEGWSMY